MSTSAASRVDRLSHEIVRDLVDALNVTVAVVTDTVRLVPEGRSR